MAKPSPLRKRVKDKFHAFSVVRRRQPINETRPKIRRPLRSTMKFVMKMSLITILAINLTLVSITVNFYFYHQGPGALDALCSLFPTENFALLYNGMGDAFNYLCRVGGDKVLNLQAVDFVTTGRRWAAVVSTTLSPGVALEYHVAIETGPLHQPGTTEVACSASFAADIGRGAKFLLVQFFDNSTISPGAVPYKPGNLYAVSAKLVANNQFHLQIEGLFPDIGYALRDLGTYPADPDGNGAKLLQISSFSFTVRSDHGGRQCAFSQIAAFAPP